MRAALADISNLAKGEKAAFEGDRVAQQAVAYNMMVIGEGARALPDQSRYRFPDIPWRDLIAQHNVVVHEYHSLDVEILWTVAREDIPQLDERLAAIETAERDRS